MAAKLKHWKTLSIVGIVLGIGLILAGWLRGALAKPEHFWSPEQAQEFEAARVAMHQLTYDAPPRPGTAASSPDSRQAEMDLARRRFEKIDAELTAARSRQAGAGAWLTRMGLAALVLFGIGYLASQGS